MNTVFLLQDKPLDYNLIIALKELYSNNVSQEYLDSFFSLKGSVEGWKKGTLLRVSNQKVKTSTEKIRENLQLYTNQLANNNYNVIFEKIKLEVEHTDEGLDILKDIMLNVAIRQENNLELLAKISIDLNILNNVLNDLISLLNTIERKTAENGNEYDQFCLDNISNLIFKNRYLFLCVFYNLGKMDSIVLYLDKLVEVFMNEQDKKVSELYVLAYVDCLNKINKTLKERDPIQHKNKIDQLNDLLSLPKKFTSKSSIAIMNLLDTFV